MLEIFVAEFFTQSKPVWIDDLGTKNKLNFFMFEALNLTFYRRNIVLAISSAALKIFCFVLLLRKKGWCFRLLLYTLQ